MTFEEFKALPDARSYHPDVMKIGKWYRDGALWLKNNPQEYSEKHHLGYIIVREDEDTFKLHKCIIDD